MRYIAFLAAVLALAACSTTPRLEGDRSPIFAALPSPATTSKSLEVKPVGEPLALEKVYSADAGSSPDRRAFQWPAVASEGKIFAIDGSLNISAFDVPSGKRLWRVSWESGDSPIRFGDIAYGEGAIFAVSADGRLARFSALTGEKQKEVGLPLRLKSGAVFCEGRVFFAGDENELIGIDAVSLSTVFTHRALSEPFQLMNSARPLCEGGKLFMPFSNGELHAIEAKSGKVLWLASISGAKTLGSFADIVAPPVVAGKAVVAKSFYGPMRALDMTTGKELWVRPSDGAAAPFYAGNVLFDVSSRELCALDSLTGAAFYCIGLDSRRIYFSPVMAGNELLLTRDDGVIEVRKPADGSLIREADIVGGVTANPFTYDGLLFLQRRYSIFAFR